VHHVHLDPSIAPLYLLRYSTADPLNSLSTFRANPPIVHVGHYGQPTVTSWPQMSPMSPRYNPWRQQTHSPSQMRQDNGLQQDNSVACSCGETKHRSRYTVTKPQTAAVTLQGRPSRKTHPRMPGRANAEMMLGRPDRSPVMHRVAICIMRSHSQPGYTT
jgi:hypothetical protein